MTIREGRWLGTIFKAGDVLLSPDIRRGLATLRGRMDTTGQTFGTWSEELRNGDVAHYSIILNGPVPIYRVRVETEETFEFACIPYSGLFSLLGYYLPSAYVTPSEAAAEGYVEYLGKEESNGDPDRAVLRAFQFIEDTDGTYTTTDWSYTGALNNQFPEGSGYTKSLVKKRGTSFSGEMRKVVQLLCGHNSEIAYEYGWQRTHGIFVNSVDDSRWVIEIGSKGVTAWPLPLCGSATPSDLIHYVPAPAPELPSYESRIELCDSITIGDAYLGHALSSEIGWAFSASGHEAQNVVYVGGYEVDSRSYIKTFRYKVTISPDAEGNPISAVLTEEASNWAYSNHIQNQVRVPFVKNCGLAAHRFDFFIGTSAAPPPIEGNIQFPVHVYYSGETAKVFDYLYVAPFTEDPADNWPSTCLTSSPYNIQNCQSFTLDPAEQGIDFIRSANTSKQGALLVGVPGAETTEYNKINRGSDWMGLQEETKFDGPVAVEYQNKISAVYGSWHVLKKRGWYGAAQTKNYFFSFIVPFFEREGYFFQEHWSESVTGSFYYESSGGWVGTTLDTNWAPLASLVYNDGSLDACIPIGSWSTRVDEETYPGKVNVHCYQNRPYTKDSVVRFYDGPFFVQNCVNPGERRVYYTPTGETTPIVNPGDNCITASPDEPPVESSSGYMKFFYTDSEGDKEVEVMDSADILFSGTTSLDPGQCLWGTPLWMGAWLDAFQTGNGFISEEPAGSLHEPKTIGSSGNYDISPLPADASTAGWFGLPFPQ